MPRSDPARRPHRKAAHPHLAAPRQPLNEELDPTSAAANAARIAPSWMPCTAGRGGLSPREDDAGSDQASAEDGASIAPLSPPVPRQRLTLPNVDDDLAWDKILAVNGSLPVKEERLSTLLSQVAQITSQMDRRGQLDGSAHVALVDAADRVSEPPS